MDLDGFSGHKLTCSSESKEGVLWFGTTEGVIVYDGFRVSKSLETDLVIDVLAVDQDEVYAVSAEHIWRFNGEEWSKIHEIEGRSWRRSLFARSREGVVWVILRTGLLRIEGDRVEPEPHINQQVTAIEVDSQNRLWLVNRTRAALSVIPIEEGQLAERSKWIELDPGEQQRGRYFRNLHAGLDGKMWFTGADAEYAVRCFDQDLNERQIESTKELGLDEAFLGSVESPNGTLWLRDRNSIYTLRGGEWSKRKLNTPATYRANRAPGVLEITSDGHLIVGGFSLSLRVIDVSEDRWWKASGLMFQCEDLYGNRWYIEETGKVVQEVHHSGEWRVFDKKSKIVDTPLVVFTSSDGVVWAAGSHSRTAAVSYYRNGEWIRDAWPDIGKTFSHLSAYEHHDGRIFFGAGEEFSLTKTDEWRGGIASYKWNGTGFDKERIPPPIVPKRVVSIVNIQNDEFFMGGTFVAKSALSGKEYLDMSRSKDRRWVDHMIRAKDGSIWVADFGRGVYRQRGGETTLFTKENGLRSNRSSHILEDSKGRIWVSSPEGISRYDGHTWTSAAMPKVLNFGREAGTLRESADGAIWINRASREWFFRRIGRDQEQSSEPTGIETTRYKNDFRGPETYLELAPDEVQGEGNVLLSWSGADYFSKTPAEDLEYSYRFDGGEWSPYRKETYRTFLNLEEGTRSFEVRARDTDGNVDQSPSVASISIVPLLWQRPWFIASEVAVVLVIAGLIFAMIRMRMRHLEESRDFKFWFFAEISHELKTPLSLILGPVEKALRDLPEGETRNSLKIARRNAKRMHRLVRQLLEFQKVEIGGLKVERSQLDLIEFLKGACANFEPLAKEKEIALIFESDRESLVSSLDVDKLQKVVDNLLSNAIKYTGEYGTVQCRVKIASDQSDTQFALIEVEDNGVGISKKELPLVFKPYHRNQQSRLNHVEGTGVGLALAYELVQICRGTIDVKSPVSLKNNDKKGTLFTVRWPLAEPSLGKTDPKLETTDSDKEAIIPLTAKPIEEGERSFTVLLVDDNSDVREFLSGEINHEFSVLEAQNGREGLTIAREKSPDLIVTDIMMPEMDGNEFCRRLKSDHLTSHIPVVIFSAKSSMESELRGMELGADAYLSKPVETPLLLACIRNQLASRQALRERFAQQMVLTPKDVTVTSLDEELLMQAISVVEERILDTELSVETLAEEMHLSRTTLYRKLKALCGQSPAAFINSIRLKRATQLMKNSSLSITEISQHVGFSDSNYFSSRFKKEFGITPSAYMARIKTGETRKIS